MSKTITIAACALGLLAGCGGSSASSHGTKLGANDDSRAQYASLDRCGNGAVFFPTGSANLDEVDRQRLDGLASCLNARQIDTVYITGAADPRGSEAENRALGERRAQVVAAYLQNHGARQHFVVRTLGEQCASDNSVLWPLDRQAAVQVQVPPNADGTVSPNASQSRARAVSQPTPAPSSNPRSNP